MPTIDDIRRKNALNVEETEPSSYDQEAELLGNKLQKVNESVTPEQRAFQGAQGTANLSMYDKKLEKLQSYGSRYMEYGFNPYINNEKLYDDLTTTGEQWMRSFKGAGKLMKIGFTDNALFGAFGDKDSHKEYEKAVDFYSSSKGGATGFMQNLVLNGGYTVGIIADMVLEEAALLGVTALTGGGAAGETLPLMGAKFMHGIRALDKFQDMRKAYKAHSELSKVVKGINQSQKGSNAFIKTLNFVNPLENTTNFVKNLKTMDQLRDMGDLGKATHGMASLFRDVKAVHLAHTEGNLEANMLGDELYEQLVANHQGELTNADVQYYRDLAKSGASSAYWENFAAISATNKLVFNNMFKAFDDLKGIGKTIGESRFFQMTKYGKDATKVTRKGWAGVPARTKMMFGDGFGTGMKRLGKNITSKGGTYFTANLGEGLQENLQEMIHAKNMHMYGNATHGDYFDSMLHGLKEQFNGQGFETFLSGFLMGGLISPVNMTVKSGGEFLGGGFNRFTDKANYQATKEAERNRLEYDAKIIDSLFERPKDIFEAKGNGLAVQEELQKEMMDALVKGDQHAFQNAKYKAEVTNLQVVMKYDMMDQFIENLESYKSMTPQEFVQAFPTVNKNITKAQQNAIIDGKIRKAERLAQNYNWVQDNMKNPINLKTLDSNNPNYKTLVRYHDYYEEAKKQLIYNKDEFLNNLERRENLLAEALGEFTETVGRFNIPLPNMSEGGTEGISSRDYQLLFNSESINGEMSLLQAEIGGSSPELESAEEKTLIKQKKEKLKKLERFKESLDEMQELDAKLQEHYLMDEDLMTSKDRKERKRLENWYQQASTRVFNRHNDYLKTVAPKLKGVAFENFSKSSFKRLHDYYKLDTKNVELDEAINVLTNENMLDELLKRQVEMHDVSMAQFKRYVENSIAMSRDKDEMEQAMTKLFKEGIGFPLQFVDEMLEKGKLPPIFYNLETDEILQPTEEKYTKAKEILEEAYDKLNIKPTKDLVEPTEEERKKAEQGEITEDELVDTDKAGGATDRRDFRPAKATLEELNQVEATTSIENYPTTVIEDLIAEYKRTVANEDFYDPKAEEVTPTNLTERFKTWVNDNAEVYLDTQRTRKTPIRNTFDELNEQQKMKLMEEGYETPEAVNELSLFDVEKILGEKVERPTEKTPVEETYESERKAIMKKWAGTRAWHQKNNQLDKFYRDRDAELKALAEKYEIEAPVQKEVEEEAPSVVEEEVVEEVVEEEVVETVEDEEKVPIETSDVDVFVEASDFVIEGITNGWNVLAGNEANSIGDVRTQTRDFKPKYIETIKGDKKIFSYLVPGFKEYAAAGRDAYFSVSIAVPSSSTTTLNDFKDALKSKADEIIAANPTKGRGKLILNPNISVSKPTQTTQPFIQPQTSEVETVKEEIPTEVEVETPDVVGEAEELTEEETKADENKAYRKDRARDIFEELRNIDTYTTTEGQTKFFKRVEFELIDNIGRKKFGYTITPEVIGDVLNEIKADLKIKDDNLNYRTTAAYANQAIDRYNRPEEYDQVEQNKQKRLNMLEELGYLSEDIDKFNQEAIDKILSEKITKEQYVSRLEGVRQTQVKEVQNAVKAMDTNFRTKEEFAEGLAQFALEYPELFDQHEDQVTLEFERIRASLANLKGFNNLKEGDIVQMSDGSLKKVSKLLKSRVKLVNYNDIVQDEITMTPAQFNKGSRRIVNDFNKDAKGLKSSLEKANVDELSDLLRTFTGGAFAVSKTVPTEEELREHFKLCK